MQPEDVDQMRRSLAIGGSLTRADIEQLLDTCAALLAERAAIARILDRARAVVDGSRRALNELHRVMNG